MSPCSQARTDPPRRRALVQQSPRHAVAGPLVECVLVNKSVRLDGPARASHHDRVSDPAVINTLATCDWVRRGQPLYVIGDSGTGKCHLLIALGTEAAMAGHRVKYVLATKLVNELVEARAPAGTGLDADL